MTTYMVAIGNFVDGTTFYGPFDDSEDAVRFAETCRDDEWQVIPLERVSARGDSE